MSAPNCKHVYSDNCHCYNKCKYKSPEHSNCDDCKLCAYCANGGKPSYHGNPYRTYSSTPFIPNAQINNLTINLNVDSTPHETIYQSGNQITHVVYHEPPVIQREIYYVRPEPQVIIPRSMSYQQYLAMEYLKRL